MKKSIGELRVAEALPATGLSDRYEIYATNLDASGEKERAHYLSLDALQLLSFTQDQTVLDRQITDLEAQQIAGALITLRNTQTTKHGIEYEDIYSSLLANEGTFESVTEELLGEDVDKSKIQTVVRNTARLGAKKYPNGIALDEFMKLGSVERDQLQRELLASSMGGMAALRAALLGHPVEGQFIESDYAGEAPLQWHSDGLCAQTAPDMFFPEKNDSSTDMKAVCTDCEVQNICLRYALSNDERFGIWGGYSRSERKQLSKFQKELVAEEARRTSEVETFSPDRSEAA